MGKADKIGFGILVVLSIILIGIGNTGVGSKIQVRITSLFSPFSGWASFLFNELKIRRENKVLKLKFTELSMRNQELQSLYYENEKLRKLLEFKGREAYKLVAARVVGRDPDPVSGSCVIDKGTIYGIKQGLPVITPDGIYGKVIEVKENVALIETIFNFNFRVAGMNLRSGVQGLVKWDGGRGCLVARVPVNSDIKRWDEIVTSEIGCVFPKGLKIGKVKEVEIDETKLFYDAILDPACDFTRVEDVFIITEVSPVEDRVIFKTPAWGIYKGIEEFPVEFEIPEPNIRTPE